MGAQQSQPKGPSSHCFSVCVCDQAFSESDSHVVQVAPALPQEALSEAVKKLPEVTRLGVLFVSQPSAVVLTAVTPVRNRDNSIGAVQRRKCCTSRSPCVGDIVVRHDGKRKELGDGWVLEEGEEPTVVEVNAKGNFKLRNPSGVVTTRFKNAKYYAYREFRPHGVSDVWPCSRGTAASSVAKAEDPEVWDDEDEFQRLESQADVPKANLLHDLHQTCCI